MPDDKASAKAESSSDDLTVAQVMQAIETLTSLFGFDPGIAKEAIDKCGGSTDPTTLYNYILDNGLAADKGGPVTPIENCPHVAKCVRIGVRHNFPDPHTARCQYSSRSQTAAGGGGGKPKGEYESDGGCPQGENWMCLQCGFVGCSRYVNGHGVAHYKEAAPAHCIAVSLADLSVWCHECNAYLKHDHTIGPLVKKLEQLKFSENDDDNDEANDRDEPTGSDKCQEMEQPDDDECQEGDERKDPPDEEGKGRNGVERDDIGSSGRKRPLWMALFGIQGDESEEEDEIEYPFGSCPDNLQDVASFISSDNCQSIVILAGAGMSVSSGIPDFRSAGGLYDTLRPELLTATEVEQEAMRMDATVALDQRLFLQNPLPCLEVNRPFILGTRMAQWKATLAHRFVELLHHKTGKLTRLYTQNIDGLEAQCHKLPSSKVIPVHGSFDRAECAICGDTSDFGAFCDAVERQIKDISGRDSDAPAQSTPVVCNVCGHPSVKPSIVLFRSPLPRVFFESVPNDVRDADLLIVVGTSLAVAPANTIVFRVPKTAMRVVVNREPVGFRLGLDYGDDPKRDYFARGNCDDVLLDLMVELGWLDDLREVLDELPESGKLLLEEKLNQSDEAKSETNAGGGGMQR